MTFELFFYLVIITAMACYAMLDGFDLGVGILHPLAKTDTERRIFLNAIGPVWDGNEVWLVIVAGGLFAGFPEVFATIFSAFYNATIALLMGLIFRAVSIEFRSKSESPTWRRNWDYIFFFGSLIIAFGVGLVAGNVIEGLPLDSNFDYQGSFFGFFHIYSTFVGLCAVSLFAMHGAIYLVMKTEGELHDRLRSWIPKCIGIFMLFYGITTVLTIVTKPYMVEPMLKYPVLFLVPLFALGAIVSVPILMKKKRDGWAFVSSCISISLLLSLSAIGTFPNMIRSTIDTAQNSLTIYNSSSSTLTLKVLAIIVSVGIPMVLAYGFYIYRVFRGKVVLDERSY